MLPRLAGGAVSPDDRTQMTAAGMARLEEELFRLRTDQRALTVEAVTPNRDGRLKPGFFATAAIQQPESAAALLVPQSAVETIAGTSRVYIVKNDSVEERIVTPGERVGSDVEIVKGVAAGDIIAAEPKGRLADGTRIRRQ